MDYPAAWIRIRIIKRLKDLYLKGKGCAPPTSVFLHMYPQKMSRKGRTESGSFASLGGHLSLISNVDGALLQGIFNSNIFLVVPVNLFIEGASRRKLNEFKGNEEKVVGRR